MQAAEVGDRDVAVLDRATVGVRREVELVAPRHRHPVGTFEADDRDQVGPRDRTLWLTTDRGVAPALDLVDRAVRHVEVDDDGVVAGSEPIRPPTNALVTSAAVSHLLVDDHLVPRLALDRAHRDRLADRDAGDVADAAGQRRPDRARVVHGTADVGARVDPRHDEVERAAERSEAGEHHAQRRRAAERPGLVDALDVAPASLGMSEVQRPDGAARPGVLAVGSDDHHVAVRAHRPGEDVQPDRVDAVVVGQQRCARPGSQTATVAATVCAGTKGCSVRHVVVRTGGSSCAYDWRS